jgi:hypothetical protein
MTWQASVNPTLGTGGFIEAKYFRIYPRMLVGFFRIFNGTTGFSAGTGAYSLSAPVAIDSAIASFSNEVTVGKASFYDDSAVATSSAFSVIYSTVGGNLFLRPPTGNIWSATVPVTPGQSDSVSGYFMYPVSAA